MTNRDSTTEGDYNRVYGADAFFELDKWQFQSYLLRSDTPERGGDNQARRVGAAWQDDELVVSAEYNAVQRNFNPEMGFLRRGDNTQYSGEAIWRPQLQRSQTIRNLEFGTSLDYYEGGNGGIETRARDVHAGIQFENNGSINFNTTQTFDRLVEETRILSATIPAGDYDYVAHTASFSTNQSRRISGTGSVSWGEFWDGTRKSFSGGVGFTPNYHLSVDATYSRNVVALPAAAITTNLLGMRVVYSMTSRMTLNSFVQYNTDTHQVSSNVRFNVIHHPLSDLYLVYNDRRDTAAGQLMERSFIVKVTNLFDF